MSGKSICKILKDVRKKIADENDIPFVTAECTYQGECAGTCPACEAELQYLEGELDKRKRLGKAIAVVGIATAMTVSAAGCSNSLSDFVDDLQEIVQPQGLINPNMLDND